MIDQISDKILTAYMSYQWPVTLGAAIAFTGGGLVVWLAGLGIGRIAIIATGAFFGCIVSYSIKTHPASFLLLGAFSGALGGFVFEAILSKFFRFGSSVYNLFLSAISSLAGVMSITLGLILLLLLKGAEPLEYIAANRHLYLSAAGAMAAFGLFEQLLLCKKPHQTVPKKIKPKKQNELVPAPKGSWRTT